MASVKKRWWILRRWYRSKRYNLGISVGTLEDEAVFLLVDLELCFFSSFLFSFTSYYRLIHNPHHLKTFLSVKLRDRAARFFSNISLLLLISPQHDVTLSHLLVKILHRRLLSNILLHLSRAEVALSVYVTANFLHLVPVIWHHTTCDVMLILDQKCS